jgi:hypothetical protein
MYAQLTMFDGPRSAELLAAAERATNERIRPLLDSNPEIRDDLVATYDLRQANGGHAILIVSRTEATLDKMVELIMTSELLPGEDPDLLPGPSRAERYEVAEAAQEAGVR